MRYALAQTGGRAMRDVELYARLFYRIIGQTHPPLDRADGFEKLFEGPRPERDISSLRFMFLEGLESVLLIDPLRLIIHRTVGRYDLSTGRARLQPAGHVRPI